MSEPELQGAFAMWRMHLWQNGVGSYEEIERMVFTDKIIKIGQCPIDGCGCKYEKVRLASKAKHTPGPWTVLPDIRPHIITENREGGYWGGGHLCSLDKYENNMWDAYIMAASPNLLAACEAALEAMDMQLKRESEEYYIPAHTAQHIWNETIAKLQSAIAQSKGEAQ